MTRRLSRRAFLSALAAGSAVGAGCSTRGAVDAVASPSFDSAIESMTVGTYDIVLELADKNVTHASLIAPDGTAAQSKQIEPGVRTVKFPILRFDSIYGRAEHYTSGVHEVVLVVDGVEVSRSLPLAPNLHITDIAQYRGGDSVVDFAKLGVTVENTGTAATWIYDIAFAGAPNQVANAEISDDISTPYLHTPDTAESLILPPGETKRYVTQRAPAVLQESRNGCQGQEVSFELSVGVADGSSLTAEVNSRFNGDPYVLTITDETLCTQVSIEWTIPTGEK